MKVVRNRSRVLFIVLCLFVGTALGTKLPAASKFATVARTVEASGTTPNAASAVSPGETTATCPPSIISGTIGTGSPNFPFTTGNQTSRLFRNAIESSCGTPKPSPGLTDEGIQFKYDAFTFHNSAILSVCITVISTSGSGNQLLVAAYQDSFNPANVESHYIGDTGNSDVTRSFSFIVDGTSDFVIVQSRVNNATNPPSLGYSFRVLGLPGCDHCPPTDISGTIGSTQSEYPKASSTQNGHLFRNAVASVCGSTKPLPTVEEPTDQFSYDAFTFLNSSVGSRCVTVSTTAGANNQILTVAYLDRFNRFDIQENYLGDAGNSDQSRSFSFTVPGHRSFVIVQGRVNNAGNPPSLSYNFSVTGLLGCACTAALDKTSESFTDLGGQGSVNVTVPGGCSWSVDNFSSSFITINGASSGTGNGTINYSVSSNAGTQRRIGTLAIAGQTFTIFEGIRFNDVPVGSQFFTEIGKLSARNVTNGCGGGNYCPGDPVLREQMAAFIIRALGDISPVFPQTQRFPDVPQSSPFYPFIDEMAEREITLGCGGGNYCPSAPVLREQMAAFIIRALGELDPPTPPTQRFADVPPSNQFYKFIDRMAVLNITQGCGSNPLRYCPSSVVTRDQMAAFLVRAFDL